MLINILTGLLTMAICLFLEALLLVAVMRYYIRHENWINDPAIGPTMLAICGVMIILVIGNIFQIGIWATLFVLVGEYTAYSTAFYHSAVNFSTLGYGDLIMSEKHRLLGPLEAVNGVLMIGVSTAILMTVFQDAMKKTHAARKKIQNNQKR